MSEKTSRLIYELTHKLAPALDNPHCSAGQLLFPAVLRLVATGKPVIQDELGRKLDMHPHLVNDTIAFLYPDTEFDSEGRLVGFGLSQRPTPHRVQFKGRQDILYAWCALDALMLPLLLGEGVRVTSACRDSGQPVSVLLGSNGVERVSPATAVVSFVTEMNFASPRASGCELQHFFTSEDAAAGWVEEHPEAVVVPVRDAFQVLHRLNQRSVEARTRGIVVLGEVMDLLVPMFVGNETERIQCGFIEKRGNRFLTDTGQPSPGDMWLDTHLAGWLDSELHRGRGGGPHLVIRLPNEWEWDLDGPMSNGLGWHRSGEPPAVTAMPSIIAGDYHGMLVQGKLIRMG